MAAYDTPVVTNAETYPDQASLAAFIKRTGRGLGFQQVGITDTELGVAEGRLLDWLDDGRHGTMEWMARHGTKRSRPDSLVPGTIRVISVRMDYLPESAAPMQDILADPVSAFVSRYALGRDYHKVVRQRLQQLASAIEEKVGAFGYRAFTDSAPVLEKPLAEKAGLGWIGKHTNLINKSSGSWFFLGELYTDLPLPLDTPATAHCGSCSACISACPTGAITGPFELDARLCVSYLTIEHAGTIEPALRPLMGNRIYGCDDCQMVCPYNSFSTPSPESDFKPRHDLDATSLVTLFNWTEEEFLRRTEGSAIRRIGFERWQRNIAVALGNAPTSDAVVNALRARQAHCTDLVREHIDWALGRHGATAGIDERR